MHKQICATLEPLILEITFTIFLHSSLRFYTCFHVIFSSFEILLLAGIKNETKVGSEVQFWVYNLYEIPKECNNMHFHIVFRYYNERLVVEDTILFLNPILFSPLFCKLQAAASSLSRLVECISIFWIEICNFDINNTLFSVRIIGTFLLFILSEF